MMEQLNAELKRLGQPEVEPEPQESEDPLTRIRAAAERWGIETPKEEDNGNTE